MKSKHRIRKSATAARAGGIGRKTHAQRRVRVAGRLDVIRASYGRFSLVLKDGSRVAGTARPLGGEVHGENVIVTGVAEFRPSGRLLRIQADVVEPATESDLRIFSVLPRPLLAAPPPARSRGNKRGLPALLGKWPGDEPLELLLAQLKSLG